MAVRVRLQIWVKVYVLSLMASFLFGAPAKASSEGQQVDWSFPANDLSGYLYTEKIQDVYTMLCGRGVCGMVDLRKNRILRLFAYGQFGTLQNLTYNVFTKNWDWFEGVHVYALRGGNRLYPFRSDSYSDDRSKEIIYNQENAEVHFARTDLYSDNTKTPVAQCSWSVEAEQTGLTFQIRTQDSDEQNEAVGLEGTLYPLYDEVVFNGATQPIAYAPRPDILNGPWVKSSNIEFVDSRGRLPRLRIAVKSGWVGYEAIKLTKRLPGALSLVFRAQTPGDTGSVKVELLPNPVTVAVCPIVQVGSKTKIRVMTTQPGVPSLSLDGRDLILSKTGEHAWVAVITGPHAGRHRLVARLGGCISDRVFSSVGSFAKAATLLAGALLRLQHQTETEWPAQNGMVPESMWRDFRPELKNEVITTSSYMPRVVMCLAAASMLNHDPKYVEEAFRMCRSYVLKSRQMDEGRFIASTFDVEGHVPQIAANWTRPSDFAIMVRGLLVCREAFEKLGLSQEATEALNLAYEVAMGLRAVQGPHGEWSPRYNYFHPHYEGGNGYVNNPHYSFWRLFEALQSVNPQEASRVQELITENLATMQNLTGDRSITSSATGGDEDIPNEDESWAAATSTTLTAYLFNQDPVMAQRAVDCAHAGIWVSDFYIDRPEYFAMPASGALLPIWLACYLWGRMHGGMNDLVQMEARLMVAEHLGDQFSADAAAYLFASRLAWSMDRDGFVCGGEQNIPGLHHRNECFTETLNYGGLGTYLLWYAKQQYISHPSH